MTTVGGSTYSDLNLVFSSKALNDMNARLLDCRTLQLTEMKSFKLTKNIGATNDICNLEFNFFMQ